MTIFCNYYSILHLNCDLFWKHITAVIRQEGVPLCCVVIILTQGWFSRQSTLLIYHGYPGAGDRPINKPIFKTSTNCRAKSTQPDKRQSLLLHWQPICLLLGLHSRGFCTCQYFFLPLGTWEMTRERDREMEGEKLRERESVWERARLRDRKEHVADDEL